MQKYTFWFWVLFVLILNDILKSRYLCPGLVKEFDAPSRLIEQSSSLFRAMVQEYADRSSNL